MAGGNGKWKVVLIHSSAVTKVSLTKCGKIPPQEIGLDSADYHAYNARGRMAEVQPCLPNMDLYVSKYSLTLLRWSQLASGAGPSLIGAAVLKAIKVLTMNL